MEANYVKTDENEELGFNILLGNVKSRLNVIEMSENYIET